MPPNLIPTFCLNHVVLATAIGVLPTRTTAAERQLNSRDPHGSSWSGIASYWQVSAALLMCCVTLHSDMCDSQAYADYTDILELTEAMIRACAVATAAQQQARHLQNRI